MFRKSFFKTKLISISLVASSLFAVSAFANGWILPNNTDANILISDNSEPTDVAQPTAIAAPAPQTRGWILKDAVAPTVPVEEITDAAGNIRIVPSKRTADKLFRAGTTVVTGFSGYDFKKPLINTNQSAEDRKALLESDPYKFIDLNGQSASLSQITDIGYGFNGDQVDQKPYDTITARDVGQVFGIAIDNARYPNLYLTASSAFGLQIVGDDRNDDLVIDRLTKGARDARWMHGQWGSFKGAGAGSVYKVDGYTRQISLFATIKSEDRENTGAALGNIAFDRGHNQFFVSDLETGLIHRINSKGELMQAFDHGVDGRTAAKRSRIRFNPRSGVDITRSDFDSLDPETWNYAKPERRVWGLAVRGGRVFYAVAEGPEVWSIGIDKETGELLNDPRWELTVTEAHDGFEISDMVFSPSGAMVLAQRPTVAASFDYKTFTTTDKAKVLRYVYESPEDDPDTPSVWYEQPEVISIGFDGKHNNGLGGVDFGASFDDKGRIDWRNCNGSLLSTGQNLRSNADLETALIKGGDLRLDGIQIAPRAIRASDNSPPWLSFSQDYNGIAHDDDITGQIGDVEVLDCGRGTGGGGGGGGNTVDGDGDELDLDDDFDFFCTKNMIAAGLCICAIFPQKCFPKKPKSCLKVEADVICNPTTGVYELAGSITDRSSTNFDGVKVDDPTGSISSLPTTSTYPGGISVDLSGMSPGQSGQLDFCAYNTADRATNEPFNCCNQTVNFKIPGEACEKGAE